MGKIVAGTFNGTGAALYMCIGFVPDWVRVIALEDDAMASAYWSREFRAADINEGGVDTNGATAIVLKTYGTGIAPYYGGELMTSDNQTSVTYAEGVYLELDDADYRFYDDGNGDGVAYDIDTWTLDTSGNRTGHFNEDVKSSGNRIGEGSKICIGGKWYQIEALTAGQGEAADEVTLNYPVPSGKITAITGMYSTKPVPIGRTSKAGFKLNLTALVNVNDEINFFEAGTYDN